MHWNNSRNLSLVDRISREIKVCLIPTLATLVTVMCLLPPTVRPADVLGYSVLKGQFFNQSDTNVLILDPDFGFSFLASVDLTDFDLVTSATLRLPEGDSIPLDSLGDYWSVLDSHTNMSSLDAAFDWGDYILIFKTVNDGDFSCVVSLPETPLPPTPRLVNFADVQAVDPGKPLTLTWEFDALPHRDDFVQVYVNLGHAEMFSTPNLGEPGALNSSARSITIPPGTLWPGLAHSLNLEITRIASTNSDCYPGAEGAGATFSSTSVDVFVLAPPTLALMSGPTNGVIAVEVLTEPEQSVVLQASPDMSEWINVATNAAPSGTNVFTLPTGGHSRRFFRAWQP